MQLSANEFLIDLKLVTSDYDNNTTIHMPAPIRPSLKLSLDA